MTAAPFHDTIAQGPTGGRAVWLRAPDGFRIRAGLWNAPDAAKGTVFLLPGRTEYIEKYGRAAADLAQRGYATLTIDWRGQGLSDRPPTDPMLGHVEDFAEYQSDLDALLDYAQTAGLPEPYYLMAHSMGGCIALRGLIRDLPFKAAAFSAPMWGISIAAWMRPLAMAISTAAVWFNMDNRYAPGTGPKTYVLEAGFLGNSLTTDPDMWDYMRAQVIAEPALALGGPSLGWLKAALAECSDLSMRACPRHPALCALGTAEKIVDTAPIHARMAHWSNGRLAMSMGAEHEVMMETLPIRTRFFDEAAELFSKNP